MGTKRDFHVKTGLTVDSGNVTLSNGNLVIGSGEAQIDNITINANTISSTDNDGAINLTPQGNGSVVISKVDINSGTVDGISALTASGDLDIGAHDFKAQTLTAGGLTNGRVVFAGTNGVLSNDSDLSFSGDTLTATKIGAFTAAGTIDFDDQDMTNVDINSGAIDGTTIGAASAAAGSFTTANVSTALNVFGRQAISSSQPSNISLKVTGANNQSADIFEVNVHGGTEKLSVSSDGTTVIATADINGGAIDGTTIGAASAAAGTFSSLTATTADINGGTIDGATVGANSATTGKFTTLEATGDIDLTGSGGSIKGDGTAAITIDNGGHITALGQSSPSTNDVLTYDGAKWVADSPASGADGMGSGFVLEDGDGTEVTVDENKEVKFIDGSGMQINWTNTSNGTDADPYALTFSLDVNALGDAAIASGDFLAFSDTSASNNVKKESIDDIATLFAGTGLTASSAVISVDAAQTQITSVGTLTGLTVSGVTDLNNNLTVDGAIISLDATSELNIDNSDTTYGIKIGTVTSGVPVSIGHTTSEVTVNDNLTVTGNLTVNGTTTTISTSQLTVEDDLITVKKGNNTLANATGGGIEIECTDGGTDNIHWKYQNSRTAWQSNVDVDLATTSESFKIAGTNVLTNNTLGAGVTSSSLTQVGALNAGSITSGFTSIDVGSGAISTTGNLTGGTIVGTSLNVAGTITGDTSLTLDNTTITTAEIGVLDGVTAGEVTASRALVVDSNRDLAAGGAVQVRDMKLRNLTASQVVTANQFSVTDSNGNSVAYLDSLQASAPANLTNGSSRTAYTIDASSFRTAKFVYQIHDATNDNYECGEILLTYTGDEAPAGDSSIFMTQYGVVSTATNNASLVTWDAVESSGNIALQFTNNTGGTISYNHQVVVTLLIEE